MSILQDLVSLTRMSRGFQPQPSVISSRFKTKVLPNLVVSANNGQDKHRFDIDQVSAEDIEDMRKIGLRPVVQNGTLEVSWM